MSQQVVPQALRLLLLATLALLASCQSGGSRGQTQYLEAFNPASVPHSSMYNADQVSYWDGDGIISRTFTPEMAEAIKAAMQPQTFLGVSEDGVASAVTTSGNPDCHIILRGGEDGPNYGADDVRETIDGLEAAKLKAAIMIDASHGNCAKDHRRMPDVFREIVRQRVAGQKAIIGAMLESNLVGGSQKFPQPLEKLVRGQSITDACIDWETTETLLREAHAVLK